MFRLFIILCSYIFAVSLTSANPNTADASTRGQYATQSAEYHLPASIDKDVLDDRKTELWAKMHFPLNISNLNKLPLIVMLHGNHGTCSSGQAPHHDNSCEYTDTGMCEQGAYPTPNHAGYDYIADHLASWGFVVVSINANRGITCGGGVELDNGLNLARGRLILKHLSMLHQWASSGNAPATLPFGNNGLMNKLDFSRVGLFGHSRGGEGARAAYNLYLDQDSPWPAKIPGLQIKGIFEIGAVDGQTSRVLDANGTNWNQLLPMCDGDVSNLEGRYPYERMLAKQDEAQKTQKSVYQVWGTNHNFYNTEWQNNDAYFCASPKPLYQAGNYYSTEQQQIALNSVSAFFRSHLGQASDAKLNQLFNPLSATPNNIAALTQIDKDFTSSPDLSQNFIFDNFDKEGNKNYLDLENIVKNISFKHKKHYYHKIQAVAHISWKQASSDQSLEFPLAAQDRGLDIHDYASLDFRITKTDTEKPDIDFSIVLKDSSGLESKALSLSNYALVNGPGNTVMPLQTVRIPLNKFNNINLQAVHSIKFIFNKSSEGEIYLANLRAEHSFGLGYTQDTKPNIFQAKLLKSPAKPEIIAEELNTIVSIKAKHKTAALANREAGVEITFRSQHAFPVMNTLPTLVIGNQQFTLSHYADKKTLKTITFTLTQAQYQNLSKQDKVEIRNGKIWKFKSLSAY